MNIELISAELRPRRPWEAIDLGISLCRRHLGKLLLLWSLSVLPVIALLSVLLWPNYLLLCLSIWWLKPLFDRVPLFYLSRALFSSAPSLREFFRALPRLLTRHLFDSLFLGRFSTTRSSVMPIKELEGLTGDAYRHRRNALMQSGGGHARWFLAICLFLWFFFTYALALFASVAMPTAAPTPADTFAVLLEFLSSGTMALEPVKIFGLLCAWVLALTFTEILYVAGGFGIYLNARTGLEGWDVELTFRRIANRVRKIQSGGLAGLLAASLLLMILPSSAGARVPGERPGEVIERVLEHEDFEIHTRTERVRKSDRESEKEYAGSFSFLAGLVQILWWLLVTIFLLLLIFLIYRNRHFFSGARSRTSRKEKSRARTILGMEITPESLPGDIVGAARFAWNENRKKEALSLLYRGALSWLVESAQSPIRESDTEIDCLGHARATPAAQGHFRYMETLTVTWIGIAYGRLEPNEDDMEQLLQGWPFNKEVPRG